MVKANRLDLELILDSSTDNIPDEHKIKTYELLCDLKEKSSILFGSIIVLGYIPEYHNEYVDPMDKDFFKRNKVNIHEQEALEKLFKTISYDGAVLINLSGKILHSGFYLSYKDHKEVLEALGAPKQGSLSNRFGFSECIGTRHVSAICASYRMPETMVYILSEETGRIRIFEKGRIIYSPIKSDICVPKIHTPEQELFTHETTPVMSQ